MLNKKKFCICIDLFKIYESDEYDKVYENLSTLKEIKINNI